ncbi:MAG TPA: type II toxin-antitoxin system death-on-curing family toxin [Kiloniellales bacterium]|nr:type II toxin-antitoxin system death-on-curing family toxin [Kiloniellales bacterium]
MTWRWLSKAATLAFHEEQIGEHGGAFGVRDLGLLESALARPENLAAYGDPDAADLAAAYAFGIAKNHPFVDGNKRTAAVLMETFLDLNGQELTADDASLVVVVLALAAGDMSEAELAQWLRENLKPLA